MADQPTEKLQLQGERGLQEYFKEQADIDRNTARLRALRLAKEAAEAELAKAAAAEKKPVKASKRRGGVGSKKRIVRR